LLPCRMALSLTISAQTSPVPNSFAISRKAGLHTPAIGASTTSFFISIPPIFSISSHAPFLLSIASSFFACLLCCLSAVTRPFRSQFLITDAKRLGNPCKQLRLRLARAALERTEYGDRDAEPVGQLLLRHAFELAESSDAQGQLIVVHLAMPSFPCESAASASDSTAGRRGEA